jgi:hypothetical protein
MWAVWGKQNFWYEYVGFWGCPIIFIAGFVTLRSLRVGSYFGLLGCFMMLFFLAPALANTFRSIAGAGLVLEPTRVVVLALIVALPLLTLGRLFLNVVQVRSGASDR